jgi:hypothetical protein
VEMVTDLKHELRELLKVLNGEPVSPRDDAPAE